jgi:stage IV sporulation protein B
MTYIDKVTGEFGGLGHPICDPDTGGIIPVSSGEAVSVEITGATKGAKGIPGELRGTFRRGGALGSLNCNKSCGVFGTLTAEAVEELCGGAEEYTLGYCQDIKTGAAEIVTTVEGHLPSHYSIEIESIDFNSSDSTKDMIIRITDPELIRSTGGIVQGMSGSPVIQDGRFIGAVTHVFVSDPTRGYAIFAENMAA